MSLHLLPQLEQDLGLLTWPLLVCAFISLLICLERLALVLSESLSKNLKLHKRRKHCLDALDTLLASPRVVANKACELDGSASQAHEPQIQPLIALLESQKTMLASGCLALLQQAQQTKSLREEVLGLWLVQKHQQLHAGLKLLQTLGVITPLLGLLGTVLGLIAMFTELGQSQGPVTPAQLSQGLGLAMNTTAAGLLIAVPSISAAHLFGFYADHHLSHISQVLNRLNLWLEGVNTQALAPLTLAPEKNSQSDLDTTAKASMSS
ncbi:MotA/TolQ/ExbB proton channel [Shewanella denitrificans OS217]|jgi:biopolymer transport protein ExbB|uniref:MotA/TolQ/ExbB proton channel n=1 Tax=Shewanella denitrificans (strain OS217 / ATCC BAA-1090 / DSM 15013) TaxID=318161 RepID=Q12R48_SHEDO|nr:MotA/TolQ/ExbB proton channel family protein [Shewanella denitrificans]ABE54078.1 MotA/TolQ/ExbB proton channel [Shewanella denitrificans OS217]